jgi:hypothetical protein
VMPVRMPMYVWRKVNTLAAVRGDRGSKFRCSNKHGILVAPHPEQEVMK